MFSFLKFNLSHFLRKLSPNQGHCSPGSTPFEKRPVTSKKLFRCCHVLLHCVQPYNLLLPELSTIRRSQGSPLNYCYLLLWSVYAMLILKRSKSTLYKFCPVEDYYMLVSTLCVVPLVRFHFAEVCTGSVGVCPLNILPSSNAFAASH